MLSFVAVKFETYNSFLLEDTVVFIPLGRCAQKVGFNPHHNPTANVLGTKPFPNGEILVIITG